jgi:hypothetical protein
MRHWLHGSVQSRSASGPEQIVLTVRLKLN